MTTVSVMNGTSNEVSENEQNTGSTNNQQENGHNDNGNKDAEAQDNLNEEDFIGLDVMDTLDDEEKDRPRRRSWDRTRGRERRNSREQDKDRERERERDRDRDRGRRRSRSSDRRKDFSRRDPSKSNKDIENDKMRTKKDTDNKVLAEKEKAIKTLLDSDEVVPPGTEVEAIENMVDKTQEKKSEDKKRDSRDRDRRSSRDRRRSPIHNRLGHRRSPRRSPNRRSPIRLSPLRRRRSPIVLSPDDRRRRSSYDRDNSVERKEASRRRLRERMAREGRRSRSRDRRSLDRHRSRSFDRHRRSSRSPYDRRRRRSLSRTPLRSPTRSRKRSPFLNEIVRQFQNDPLRPDNAMPPMQQPLGPMHGMGPGGAPYMPPGGGPPGLHPGIVPGQGLLPTPQGMMSGPPGPMDMGPMPMHPGVGMHPGPGMPGPPGGGPPFLNYDAPPAMNFDLLNRGPSDYLSAPVMYNQGNPIPPMNSIPHPMRPPSPQPVPAPGLAPTGSWIPVGTPVQKLPQQTKLQVPGTKYSPHDTYIRSPDHRTRGKREGRMKTPEPPIISDLKQNEKTSLSSLLEASVSSKDSSSLTASFKGFRQEIIRNCERALRSLPAEDPRLKMKGRFFFDPMKKDISRDKKETASNSILLRKGRTEIHWDEEENQLSASTQQQQQQHQPLRKRVVTHQKICQTDETTRESIGTQIEPEMTDFWMQVNPLDLLYKDDRRGPIDDRRAPIDDRRPPIDEKRPPIDERRPPIDDRRPLIDDRRPPMDDRRVSIDDRRIMDDGRRPLADRLDWSMRETFDHSAKLRDNTDLRWSLSNSSSTARERQQQPIPWTRSFSPSRQTIVSDHLHRSGMPISGTDNMPRGGIDRIIDARDRVLDPRDRLMDSRDRDLEMREREMDIRDVRGMDMMMRDRERMLDDRREGMMMGGGSGVGGLRDTMMNDSFGRQQNVDDYEMRKNPFSRGMDRDIPPRDSSRDSPTVIEDDPEELEIIEERGFDRDQPWKRNSGNSLAAFNNARGAAAAGIRGGSSASNRAFRGRAGGYRR